MILLYNIVLLLFSLFLFPWLLYRSIVKEKYRLGMRQRLGFFPKEILKKRSGKRLIWIQAVSVGEALAVKPLITGIRKRFTDCQILISTTTLTGYKICLEKVAQAEDIVIFFPLDYFWTVRKALHIFHPSLIILVETEIWPNFIYSADKNGIPVILVNGRISDKSYRGYMRFRRVIKNVLSKINWFGMQSENDAGRIIALGAEKDKVKIISSLKYEGAIELAGRKFDIQDIRGEIMLPENATLIVGGSTHSGEEEALIKAYLRLKPEFPNIAILIAPRHLERIKDINEYLNKEAIPYCLKSQVAFRRTEYKPVIVLDTLGELMKYYAVATLVFVGKSLYGKGGQNPIEPAALGKPVIFGVNMTNFTAPSELLIKQNAAICVKNDEELYSAIHSLLVDSDRSKRMGSNGREAILAKKGAVDIILNHIAEIVAK